MQLRYLISKIYNTKKVNMYIKNATTKQQLLDQLFLKFSETKPCVFCTPNTNIVFGEGNANADIMFIGEAPGQEEDRFGRPFVGRSGKLLNKALSIVGIERNEVYITNVIKCRPPNNRTPSYAEMQQGKKTALDEQIKIISPKIICTLGAVALSAFFDHPVKISKLHGQAINQNNFILIPIYHPAYILRNQKEATNWLYDLQKVKNALHNFK